ncbi:hypothetical protein TsFJ059_000979 [Trichoderma semiorbis]|uniref:Uncharacterized protein n=1 Tax=Trichoderma semiorbis TaxID=1491008 RepID=A0A9P8HWF8_9HYPO|nr:hypothetical protein TsFJ059_000979 [Trichoderma semiorbis]
MELRSRIEQFQESIRMREFPQSLIDITAFRDDIDRQTIWPLWSNFIYSMALSHFHDQEDQPQLWPCHGSK